MRLVVVTDIFGRTPCFEEFLNDISSKYSLIEVLDPYNGEEVHFKNEDAAYKHFQEKMGLDNYSDLLYQNLKGRKEVEQLVLGFSVGASAIWINSEKLKSSKKTKAICFYSSQVRNFLQVKPNVQVDFYFSKYEPSYEVDDVISKLSNTVNVSCYKTEYLHGFMNRKSTNFNRLGYKNYLEILNNS